MAKEEPVKEAQIISDNLSFQIRNPLFQSDQTDIVTASASRAGVPSSAALSLSF
jgi:hypothetical protein